MSREKLLRLLSQEATRLQPSIIFFDEIDGLAPVRSSKQDYIHASIVSTLLALMDGLDSRGQVRLRLHHRAPRRRRPRRRRRRCLRLRLRSAHVRAGIGVRMVLLRVPSR